MRFGFTIQHASGRNEFSESEVEYFDQSARGDHYVLRFDIAMNNIASMSLGERVSYWHRNLQSFFQLQWLPVNAGRKSFAVDILHDDEGVATVFAHFMNRADVRMIECSGGLRFTHESLLGLLVSS